MVLVLIAGLVEGAFTATASKSRSRLGSIGSKTDGLFALNHQG